MSVDSSKLAKLNALAKKRQRVVTITVEDETVEAIVRPAKLSATVDIVKVFGEQEVNIVALMNSIFHIKDDADEKEAIEAVIEPLVPLLLTLDLGQLLEVAGRSTDIPLDHEGVPYMAVVVIVAHWLLITFDPDVNGPFVQMFKMMLPESILGWWQMIEETVKEWKPTQPLDTPTDSSEYTPTTSGTPAESSPQLETANS